MIIKGHYREIKYSFWILILGMVLLTSVTCSCVEEYWPDMKSSYEEALVVDGSITNKPGPKIVKLSMTSSIHSREYKPLTGYTVRILDNEGNEETLQDLGDGTYKGGSNGIEGIPGRSYKIHIQSPDGKEYGSSFEKMAPPVDIDTVWAEYETMEDQNYDHTLEGYQFYISTEPSSIDTTYFLWKLQATYEYKANHNIRYVYDGSLKPFSNYDSLKTCWMTYKVPEIFTHHTLHLSEPYLIAYPLHFVNTEDKKLSVLYSLYTEQFVISKQAHDFWEHIRKQENNQGSLYATLPFQIRGNVECISNPEEPVLGYFMTASVTSNRMFAGMPWWAKFYYPRECYLATEEIFYLLELMENQWPVYLAVSVDENGVLSIGLPSNQECVDCTKSGGTIIKPNFWITR